MKKIFARFKRLFSGSTCNNTPSINKDFSEKEGGGKSVGEGLGKGDAKKFGGLEYGQITIDTSALDSLKIHNKKAVIDSLKSERGLESLNRVLHSFLIQKD